MAMSPAMPQKQWNHAVVPAIGPVSLIGPVEQRQHVAQRTMQHVVVSVCHLIVVAIVVVVDHHVGPGGAHPAALDLLEHDGVTVDAEAPEDRRHHVGVGAAVDQRRHRHVAGDAGLTVEPGDAPGGRHRLGHVNMRAIAHAAPKPLSMPTTVTPLAHDACMASRAVTPSSPAP